eukprot:CAMPEP_0172359308 /NCGR_PEP_ID=MMETSP1060-20121228/3514_1 /TAXON_ID=37318 /ORGANISM="Pseudo-nitzschia pungens, Strain cf. cingulata" /LENGTH=599 /DNA_ID=CAMNT_0013080889 /DNA_START=251 /DNA_END=2050 /DNA_ORIENTATION=-
MPDTAKETTRLLSAERKPSSSTTNAADAAGSDRLPSWLSGRGAAAAALIVTAVLWMGLLSNTAASSGSDAFGSVLYHGSSASLLLDQSHDATELYYTAQQVDHLHLDDGRTYSQRYYKIARHFRGPGHPILVIMGGEDALELPMLYPFVHDKLASEFGAFVLSPEHRFYGASQPVPGGRPTVDDMMRYLSPDQALEDAVQLIQHIRKKLGCDPARTHPGYCPVITFGGSYPGFLSAMLRFRYPDLVDAAYASSAPLDLYSQLVDSNAYFDKVTDTAELASEGCADAVRSTLVAAREELVAEFGFLHPRDRKRKIKAAAAAAGFCPDTFPSYITTIEEFVSETVQYLVPAIFADFNMAYYPPGPDTALARACAIFQDPSPESGPTDKLRRFFDLRGVVEYGEDDDTNNKNNHDNNTNHDNNNAPDCFDLSLELPDGPHSRIRGSDNSGTGGGHTGEIWEFQCCRDLIIRAGYSERSMFLPRPFSYAWHEEHCSARFPGIIVEPYRMNLQWGFDDLTKTSRIVFANGLNDGWSTSSMTNATELEGPPYTELKVLNFPNGAHHSELSSKYPNPNDTEDIVEGYEKVTEILAMWLDEVYAERQ